MDTRWFASGCCLTLAAAAFLLAAGCESSVDFEVCYEARNCGDISTLDNQGVFSVALVQPSGRTIRQTFDLMPLFPKNCVSLSLAREDWIKHPISRARIEEVKLHAFRYQKDDLILAGQVTALDVPARKARLSFDCSQPLSTARVSKEAISGYTIDLKARTLGFASLLKPLMTGVPGPRSSAPVTGRPDKGPGDPPAAESQPSTGAPTADQPH